MPAGALERRVEKAAFNVEPSAKRHGVARIDGEIHQDLVELMDIAAYEAGTAMAGHVELHVFTDHAAEQRLDVIQQFAKIDDAGFGGVPAAEGEELAGHAGGAFGGVDDLLHVAREFFGTRVHAFERELAIAGNDGEEIVKVVRNTAGEASERLHFARLGELLFEIPALGDIDADAADQHDLAVFHDRKFVDEPVVEAIGVRGRFDELNHSAARDHRVIVLAMA